ncbi:MAG TPA: hypothetical protein VFS59_11635 [Gemmatimonadaceae bacterium]|nr:hypothetical protein [Gemmatimonadaceae bacterium]
MTRVPTRKQQHLLTVLAGGLPTVLAPGKRDWRPLLRRGWVEPNPRYAKGHDERDRFLPPLRITPAGLRALADAMERYEGEGGDA